ncbi:MAG: histidine phosphatase family protein [Coriobacteriales bacterium]
MDPHGYTAGFSRRGHLLLMRHAQTVANEQHRYLGQRNAPLTELGERQRQRGVEGLVAWRPDRIVSSPLDRCRVIAEPAAKLLGCPFEVDERVAELDFGVIEDCTSDQIRQRGLPLPWGDSLERWPAPGAESLEEFCGRLADAADHFATLVGKTAVVSHGGAIRGMLAHWLGIPPERMWQVSLGNVRSVLLSVEDADTVYLERLGLAPEELGQLA